MLIMPAAVPRLREFILDLAVSGGLVPRHDGDQPATELMRQIGLGEASRLEPTRGRVDTTPTRESLERLPSGWVSATVGQLFRVTGGIQKQPKRTPTNNAFPYLGVSNVQRGRLDLRNISRFELFPGELEKYRLEPGDLLAVEGNGSPTEIGRCALWNGEIADCVHQNHIIRCRPRYEGIERFILLYLNSSAGIATMRRLAITTAGLYSLSVGKIQKITIPVPPLDEQRRIVAKVDELMALCDQLEEAKEYRESQRDALRAASLNRLAAGEPDVLTESDIRLFLDALPRLITKPEHVGSIRTAILGLAVQGQLTSPGSASWATTTLGNVGTWGSGGTPTTGTRDYYGGSIPWVVIGDLNEGVVSHTAQTITELGLEKSSAKLIEPGTVLIAMYGASVGKMGIAGVKCATNQAIAHCVPDSSVIERDYLFVVLQSLRASLIASAKGGAQPNISQSILKGWHIALPPIAEQRLIVAKVDELLTICDNLESALTSSGYEEVRLLEALLHEALAGTAVVSIGSA